MSQLRLSYFNMNCIFCTDLEKFANNKFQENPSLAKEFVECWRKETERWTKNMKLTVAYFAANFKEILKMYIREENIPFWQAALVSGQNTYTHSPLADTPVLRSETHEYNFHAEGQPFWTSCGDFLVSFIVTSLPFPSWYLQCNRTQRALLSKVCIKWVQISTWCVNCM
jgi:hypothetical protein